MDCSAAHKAGALLQQQGEKPVALERVAGRAARVPAGRIAKGGKSAVILANGASSGMNPTALRNGVQDSTERPVPDSRKSGANDGYRPCKCAHIHDRRS